MFDTFRRERGWQSPGTVRLGGRGSDGLGWVGVKVTVIVVAAVHHANCR